MENKTSACGMYVGQKLGRAYVWQVGDIVFIKSVNGAVYAMRTRSKAWAVDIHFDADWNVNNAQRSAFCKLTGQKLADLQRAIKARKERDRKSSEAYEVAKLRRLAAKHRLKVVPLKGA